MKITNKYKLPQALVDAVSPRHGKRNPKTYWPTMLIDAPRAFLLKERHDEELEEDAANRIWALIGNNTHYILEKMSGENCLKEETFEIDFPDLDRKVRGRLDLYEENSKKILADYKVTSVWSYIYKTNVQKWEEQLNINAYGLRTMGFEPNELQVVLLLRDWSKSKAAMDPKYPQVQVQIVKLKIWSNKKQEKFIRERIKLFMEAEKELDENLPICTPKDRWQKDDKYAVKKGNNKRALRVLNTKKEALEYIKAYKQKKPNDKLRVEYRKGEDLRCICYCSACKYCNYWIENYGTKKNKEES